MNSLLCSLYDTIYKTTIVANAPIPAESFPDNTLQPTPGVISVTDIDPLTNTIAHDSIENNATEKIDADLAHNNDNNYCVNEKETSDIVQYLDSQYKLQFENITHTPCPDTIRHIVISGGGEIGLSFYASLRESHKTGFWKRENIETIYGTSTGAIFAVAIALLPFISWDEYDDFFLKRPWENVLEINVSRIVKAFYNVGIYGRDKIDEMCLPCFNAIDMPINITMKEFYESTKVELHIISTELVPFESVDISYITHPDWLLLDAVYSSACLPGLFIPYRIKDTIYIDGGLVINYPVNQCIERASNPDEILGLTRVYVEKPAEVQLSSLLDYVLLILSIVFVKVMVPSKKVKHQIDFIRYEPVGNLYRIYNSIKNYDSRMKLFEDGVQEWRRFYEKTYYATPQ
jgi:hypothetical protein